MIKMIVLVLVGLSALFVLPAIIPQLDHVATHVAGFAVRYSYLLTVLCLGITMKALGK